MSSLVHCIYTSCANATMSYTDIDALISHSRENNTRRGVSGVLLYIEGWFMQVLEGESAIVDHLYTNIQRDPRHSRITSIIFEAIPHRFFEDLPMGIATLGAADVAQILETGTAEDRETLLSSIDEGRAKKLIRAFSAGRWRQAISLHPSTGHVPSAGAKR